MSKSAQPMRMRIQWDMHGLGGETLDADSCQAGGGGGGVGFIRVNTPTGASGVTLDAAATLSPDSTDCVTVGTL